MSPRARLRRILTRASYPETRRITEILRLETTGGLLLLAAALIAIVWANSPASDAYFALRDFEVGYEPWHLRLSLGAWAADGLLAVFFFLVGLELKREFVAGDLRDPSRALVPVTAAVGGVVVPALIYLAVNAGNHDALRGWAIPTATDIAFAVAVLAIIGSHLPSALRIFLLTLAVVDDLIAILIIALVYTTEVHVAALLLALVPLAAFTLLVQRFPAFFGRRLWAPWVILLPIAFAAWALVHASGVHATIAGVLLGFAVPVLRRDGGDGHGLAEEFEHRFRPISAGFAVPVFAFFAAGVAVGGWSGLVSAFTDTVTLGIVAGLVIGKLVGISATTWLLTRFTRASLDDSVAWIDLIGVALLGGIGFTVSLLVGELSFGLGSPANDHAKVGVLMGSVLAALLASTVLVTRNRHYRAVEEAEQLDTDADGVPDVFETDAGTDPLR